jgi:hypothetical protein
MGKFVMRQKNKMLIVVGNDNSNGSMAFFSNFLR